MSLLVVGSVAYDNIITPRSRADDLVGGSAVYFSVAASLYTPVRLVGVVGDDFGSEHVDWLASRSVDTSGLEVVAGGKTFRWTGEYSSNMNQRETLSVELNVFEDFRPKIPEPFRDSRLVFLANGSPVTQLEVLDQVRDPECVVADTMDLWIETQRSDLEALLRRVDGVVINDSEVLQLARGDQLLECGRRVLDMGPKFLVVKKGEHGCILMRGDDVLPLPAYPTARVEDPTGAGDSFAGGMMGYLGTVERIDALELKRAIARGTVAASFTVEGFGVRGLQDASRSDLDRRYDAYREILSL